MEDKSILTILSEMKEQSEKNLAEAEALRERMEKKPVRFDLLDSIYNRS